MSMGATAPDECSYSARHLHTHFLDGDVARAILVESREYLAQRRLFRPAFACGAHRLGARRDELVNGKRPVFVGTMGEFFIEVVVLQGNMRVGGVTRAKDCTSALLMSDMRVQRRRNARQHNRGIGDRGRTHLLIRHADQLIHRAQVSPALVGDGC